MALAARALFRTFLTRNAGLNSGNMNGVALSRNVVTSTSGAILPKPGKVCQVLCLDWTGLHCSALVPFGVLRMTVVVVPFLYVGTLISKKFAAVLEEHDIFVPDDDDD